MGNNATLADLHELLWDQIQTVKGSENLPRETQHKVLDSAQTISSLAKQMINNADVILRAQKLIYDKKMPGTSVIGQLIDPGYGFLPNKNE